MFGGALASASCGVTAETQAAGSDFVSPGAPDVIPDALRLPDLSTSDGVVVAGDVPRSTADADVEDQGSAAVDAGGDGLVAAEAGDANGGLEDGGPVQQCPPPPASMLGVSFAGTGRYRTATSVAHPGLLPRDVTVLLPMGYAASRDAATRYPVVYMHDGQNLFDDAAAAFGTAWEVDDVIDAVTASGAIAPHIVVAIDSTPERLDDYTPTFDADQGAGGKGDAYADFLALALKPVVDAQFRTRCGREHTAVLGSSLGGLVSLHIGHRHPDIVGRVGAVSPSLWWDGGAAASTYQQWAATASSLPYRIWIDAGGAEGWDPDQPGLGSMVSNARLLRSALLGAGMHFPGDLGYLEEPSASHDEASWERRLPSILSYLLRDPQAPLTSSPSAATVKTFGPFTWSQAPAMATLQILIDGIRLSPPSDAVGWSSTPEVTVGGQGWVSFVGPGLATVTGTYLGVSHSRTLPSVPQDGSLVAVAIRVQGPLGTPESATLRLVGDHPATGAWDASQGVDAAPLGGQWYEVRLALDPSSALEYKWTLGAWSSVEKASDGAETANRVLDTFQSPLTVTQDVVEQWASEP